MNNDDFDLDLLAGIFSNQERILAEQGEEAFRNQVFDDVMTVGSSWMSLEANGWTDIQILAQIDIRQQAGTGFTHISFTG